MDGALLLCPMLAGRRHSDGPLASRLGNLAMLLSLPSSSGMVVALVAAAMNLFAYWKSDKLVLSMYSAHEADERAAPELYGLVGQLAREAELPMPRVYIMDNPQPNAFATGRNPEHAAVAVTTGLLQRLNKD